MDLQKVKTTKLPFPLYGWAGLLFLLVFWYINWWGEGLRTHWAFFPLWTGYILLVDALAVRFGRPSIVLNIRILFKYFLLSIPVWWIFEFINDHVYYWQYIGSESFAELERNFWKTLCFSTVIPAVFVTVNLFWSVPWFNRHHIRVGAGRTPAGRGAFFVAGWLMLAFTLIFPEYGMAFLWISLFFMIDPVNYWFGNRSILRETAEGDWRTVIVFFAAALSCGFFWEMWNIHSWPKWIYTFPFLNGLKVFEMPLAGYLGYLPFGLELFALVALFNVPVPGREGFS